MPTRGDDVAPERCEAGLCIGTRLQGRYCLEHVGKQDFDTAVQRLREGEPLDARHTAISSERLQALLLALRSGRDRLVLPEARFAGATFDGPADFADATFHGPADFTETIFNGAANFTRAAFDNRADFDEATFNSRAEWDQATFSSSVGFVGATFEGLAGFVGTVVNGRSEFDRATFNGDTHFTGVTFSGHADFDGATFNRHTDFDHTRFDGHAHFIGAVFSRDVCFNWTRFSEDTAFHRMTVRGDANFVGAAFLQTRQLGPLVVRGTLTLDRARFDEHVNMQIAATALSAWAATFAAGTHLRVRWAEIAIDDVDFGRASILSGASTWPIEADLERLMADDERGVELVERPRLITLRGANVATLALSGIDLRACRFFGAHGLETVRVDASCEWPPTPEHWRTRTRETIAEEHPWREDKLKNDRFAIALSRLGIDATPQWHAPHTRSPAWLGNRDGQDLLEPKQIAALYRSLRKAREDNKDEAGAGDLYYGEMEMRRHDPHSWKRQRRFARGRSERSVLAAYWVMSGYGLRAARALLSLVLAIAIGAALLWWFGFHDPRNYGRSLLFALESSVSPLRAPPARLSAGGQIVQITLRLLGPLLFGLALLAVRARVKR